MKAFIIRGSKAIIVDAGVKGSSGRIIAALEENGIKPEDVSLIIITHAHTDHFGGLPALKSYIDAPVAVHESEAEYLRAGKSAPVELHGLLLRMLSGFFKRSAVGRVEPSVTFGDRLELAKYGVDGFVMHTPGHTAGSASVVLAGGDTIVGDLFGGKADGSRAALPPIYSDMAALKRSVGRVAALRPMRIHTSHGGVYTPEAAAKLL